MREPKAKLDHLAAAAAAADKVKYPGKSALESASAWVIGPTVERWTAAHVMRLLGYWQVRQVVGSRAAIVDRGWMSRRAAYQAEADFRRIFGVDVEQFDPERLPQFLEAEQVEPEG